MSVNRRPAPENPPLATAPGHFRRLRHVIHGHDFENGPAKTMSAGGNSAVPNHSVVRTDLSFQRKAGSVIFRLNVDHDRTIANLAARLPGKNRTVWKRQTRVKAVALESTPGS